MHPGEQAPGEQEAWVAGDGFIEHARGLREFLPALDWTRAVVKEQLSAQVKIVGGKIFCGWFLDRSLFARRAQ